MFFDIKKSGAILLGNNFTVDGHFERNFRVVTHFHADHILELNKSISSCVGIISTPPTLEVLSVLGYDIPKRKAMGINYGVKIAIEDEKIELVQADHVFGAAQVVVTNSNGESVGYTGDFKNPGRGTPILNTDVLIIDATYGKPSFKRKFREEVEILFSDYVNDSLIYGPVRVYAYHGKIQEAMKILRKNGIMAPFIVDGKIKEVTDIATKYGLEVKDVFSAKSPEAKEIIRDGWYVEFKHFHEFKNRDPKFTNFILSGWEFSSPVRDVDKKSKVIALSDHADFEELVYYVDSSSASLIVADGSRKGYYKEFVDYVNKYLNKKAIILPKV